eukprot:TRINITY_DN57274_c0_g1_i1.p1 TRINITY_DN57274_c0_g1~~TRINITY_DN57274_c0_g1_i1.p1  ORF type:complete len:607 (-),score=155.12 TRINITY_DN57274_c0_g1_i1:239-2059(-)
MGDIIGRVFVDPSTLPSDGFGLFQLLFLGAVYGSILKTASQYISDGSELLLLIPSLAGLVGTVVLPILGAVPDGAIVLFSGIGPIDTVQEQVAVGVGALAGSTIMLLTIPWAMTIWFGRVSIMKGVPNYHRPPSVPKPQFHKLLSEDAMSLTRAGISPGPDLRRYAFVMLVTALGYLVVQIPAFRNPSASQTVLSPRLAHAEHPFAFVATILSVVLFVGYLVYCVQSSRQAALAEELTLQAQKDAVGAGIVSVRALFSEDMLRAARAAGTDAGMAATEVTGLGTSMSHSQYGSMTADGRRSRASTEFRRLVRSFFLRYDVNGDGMIDLDEMRSLLTDLGEQPTHAQVRELVRNMGASDAEAKLSFDQFVDGLRRLLVGEVDAHGHTHGQMSPECRKAVEVRSDQAAQLAEAGAAPAKALAEDDDEGAGSDEEDVPEDLRDLSPQQQQRRILLRALWMMGIGTVLVLVFSDPMVGVLDGLGSRLGIGGFYVSFVLAPLASNLSEVIAAASYAAKRTSRTATIALQQLLGAAIMNNTFCLGIFLALITVRGLPWVYTAETLAILAVELVMAAVAQTRLMYPRDAVFVAMLYPMALALVYVLENVVGWN